MSNDSRTHHKPVRNTLRAISRSQRLVALIVVVLVGSIGAYTLWFSHAATPAINLSLSPSSQSVTTGSNLVISVKIDTEGAAVNTVQSVLSYNPANFSFVSIALGPTLAPPDGSYISPFTYSTSSGSIQFSAAPPAQNITNPPPVVPITSTAANPTVVVTITLKATGTGTSAINFASICGTGVFDPTCTAAYDNTSNLNDLIGATNPITGGSYTVNPILPNPPTNPTAAAINTTSIALSWTAGSEPTGGGTFAGYKIYRDAGSSPVATTAGTTFNDTGLAAGSSHTYSIYSYDSAGNLSATAATTSASTVSLPPTPTGLQTTGSTANSIALSWTGHGDPGGPGLGGYKIYRGGVLVGTTTGTGTTFNNTGLSPGTSYTYTVAAYDTATPTANLSATSTSINASTKSLATPPTSITATSSTTSSISLSWSGAADTGGPGIGGYKVYRNGTLITTTTGTGTTFTDNTGLAAGTTYNYTISTTDTDGISSAVSASFPLATKAVTGDLDGDGHVTGHDLSVLLSHYGTNYAPAEFDGGTLVQGHDLSILLSNYGK